MPTQVDRRLARALPLTVIFASLLAAPPARADSDEGFNKHPDDLIAADKQARAEKGDKMPGEKDKAKPADPSPDKYDPTEDPSKAYRFIGVRFRDVIVPKFMINIFADGGATVNVPMVGIDFTTRKDHFQFVFGLQYADYSMSPFMFKGHSEGEESFEIVSSSMKMLLFTADLLYEIPLDKQSRYGFLIGGGVGIGGVFGGLYRAQAAPRAGNTADANDQSQWKPCSGDNIPATTTRGGVAFCDSSNAHYNSGPNDGRDGYSEPSWANGGSKPLIFPWIALPQIGFRWKPIKQFESRFDFGFSTSGFFLGFTASYGL